jgi:uncharacterized protein YutE (UPF0331/DUF86 family)
MESDLFEPVRRKLRSLLEYLDELESELPARTEDYLSAGRVLHGFVERKCQIAVECAIDANALLLSLTREAIPASARDLFEEVRQLGAIEEEVRRRFNDTFIGFRNRLVHDYERLDQRAVYHTARLLIFYGRQFATNLTAYLDRQQAVKDQAAPPPTPTKDHPGEENPTSL